MLQTEISEDTTPAQDTLHPQAGSTSKGDLMQRLVDTAMGMDCEDLSAWLDKSLALIGHEADLIPNDAAAKNQASIAAKSSPSITKEDLQTIFEGQEVTDENLDRFKTLFEAAVIAEAAVKSVKLEEEYEANLKAEVEKMQEQLSKYLDYVVKEWMTENTLAVDSSLKAELFEDFVEDMRDVMVRHHIDVPEDKLDVLVTMQEEIEDLKTKLNEAENKNIEAKKIVQENKRESILDQVAEGMTLLDIEKFKVLAENVAYDGDDEKYTRALSIVKDKYVLAPVALKESTSILEEGFEEEEVEKLQNPTMRPYVDFLNRMASNDQRV